MKIDSQNTRILPIEYNEEEKTLICEVWDRAFNDQGGLPFFLRTKHKFKINNVELIKEVGE